MAFDVLDEHEQGEQVQKWLRENALSILIGDRPRSAADVRLAAVAHASRAASHGCRRAVRRAERRCDEEGLRRCQADRRQAQIRLSPTRPMPCSRRCAKPISPPSVGTPKARRIMLDWAWQHAGIDALKAVAGLNLARVEIAQTKAQDALDLLDKLPKGGFDAAFGRTARRCARCARTQGRCARRLHRCTDASRCERAEPRFRANEAQRSSAARRRKAHDKLAPHAPQFARVPMRALACLRWSPR